jgi:hypothetical protein
LAESVASPHASADERFEGGGFEFEAGDLAGAEVELDEGADDLLGHDPVGEFGADGGDLQQKHLQVNLS